MFIKFSTNATGVANDNFIRAGYDDLIVSRALNHTYLYFNIDIT